MMEIMNHTTDNFADPDMCKECGGKCCKQMAGIAYPSDFAKPLLNSLIKAFNSGKWAIDWYEGYKKGRGYYIRPAHKDTPNLYDPSWGGECTFLTSTGCELPSDERPIGCRMLEPRKSRLCIVHEGTKLNGADAWLKYEDIIEEATQNIEEVI